MKQTAVSLLIRFYALLLRLYPASFRDAFGEEMTAVFATALTAAVTKSHRSLLAAVWRELRDWPGAALRAHLLERRLRKMSTSTDNESLSWFGLLVGVLLFAIPVILNLRESLLFPVAMPILFLILFIILALFVLGIFTEFPRWFFAYAGLIFGPIIMYLIMPAFDAVLVKWMRQVIVTNDIAHRLAWNAILNGIFWLIALITIFLVSFLFATLRPRHSLYARMRNDWTRVSFFLYGALPFILFLEFDEYQHEGPYLLAASFCFAVGAWGHMHTKHTWQRILALCLGAGLGMLAMAVGKWIITPNQNWPFWFSAHSPVEERWIESLRTAVHAGLIPIVLTAPWLLMRWLPNDAAPGETLRESL